MAGNASPPAVPFVMDGVTSPIAQMQQLFRAVPGPDGRRRRRLHQLHENVIDLQTELHDLATEAQVRLERIAVVSAMLDVQYLEIAILEQR